MEDYEAWEKCQLDNLWIFDKLILSRKLGYICGPVGMDVPTPGEYVIRPAINFRGMGIEASIQYIEDSTDHLHPGLFWCEVFRGRHLSVDYIDEKQVLCVEGIREEGAPLYKWSKWFTTEDQIPFPIKNWIKGKHRDINCEFIGDKLIEVHLRLNPDFTEGITSLEVVWNDDTRTPDILSAEYKRKGFIIK